MAFSFFMSYARKDGHKNLTRFFERLQDEVRRQLPNGPDIAFIDTKRIEIGDEWEITLAEALRSSRACVCLYSSAYFNRPYCGKEFEVFRQRREAWIRAHPDLAAQASVIFPVLWEQIPADIPRAAKQFEYTYGDDPIDYADMGLRRIMELRSRCDQYNMFVHRLGDRIAKAIREVALPNLPELRSFKEIPNAFAEPAAELIRPRGLKPGVKNACFLFLAAARHAIRAVRNCLDPYGDSGWSWQPYYGLSDEPEPIGAVAQEVASKLKLRYCELPVGPDAIEMLTAAETIGEPVILLTDVWSIKLDEYSQLAEHYDNADLKNSTVLVPWNDSDPETSQNRPSLDAALKRAFRQKIALNLPQHNWDIRSLRQLRDEMESVLTEHQMALIRRDLSAPGEVFHDAALDQHAYEEGLPTAALPKITGPVRR